MSDRSKAIQAIRDAAASFGDGDLSNLTDDEIERGIMALFVVQPFRLTVDEAVSGLRYLAGGACLAADQVRAFGDAAGQARATHEQVLAQAHKAVRREDEAPES